MSSAVAKAPTRTDVERLTSLGERFRLWQKRQGGSYFKTPSYLWDDAFELVPLFGARHVARELGLNREELLRRMNEEQQPVVAGAPASAGGAGRLPGHRVSRGRDGVARRCDAAAGFPTDRG